MTTRRIKWDEAAKRQYFAIIEFVLSESVSGAEKIDEKFQSKLVQTCTQPYSNPPDKYRSQNDGSYRAFNVYSYRVSYRILDDEIRILRIRHTSMKPKSY